MRKPAFVKNRGVESAGSGNKQLILKVVIVIVAIAALVVIAKWKGSDGGVTFTPLTEDAIPQQISSEVIPEYRDMERALACVADEKVYVVAMRGEKPTTGYDIAIDSMALTSNEDGEKTLTVNVLFTDPQAGASLTQAQTYPYVVAETDLEDLPDKIEMKIKYTD